MTDVYTIDEVACHNNAEDLWIVIDGAIYNITEFHKEHPGGEQVLLELAGQDGTDCFESVGHSYEAINLRKRYKIGELVGQVDHGANSDEPKTKTNTEVKEPMKNEWQSPKAEECTSKSCSKITKAIFIVVLVYLLSKLIM